MNEDNGRVGDSGADSADLYKGRLAHEHWPRLCDALRGIDDVDLVELMIETIEAEGGFGATRAPLEDHRRIEKSVLTDKWYAIQNSELDFINDSTTWLAPLMDLTVTNGIASAAKIIAFGLNYIRKRVELTPIQSLVLQELCNMPGKKGTIEALAARSGVPERHIVQALMSASNLRNSRTNKPVALVENDGDVWMALDL